MENIVGLKERDRRVFIHDISNFIGHRSHFRKECKINKFDVQTSSNVFKLAPDFRICLSDNILEKGMEKKLINLPFKHPQTSSNVLKRPRNEIKKGKCDRITCNYHVVIRIRSREANRVRLKAACSRAC